MSDFVNGPSWAQVLGIFSALIGLLGVALKLIYRDMRREIAEKTNGFKQAVEKLDKDVRQYFEAHEKLRDKWEEFLREYLKIDATRGNKVDALFRVVDQLQDTFKELKPALNARVEDAFQRAISELKVYVRDQMRGEISALDHPSAREVRRG